jgi:drug/metabolite transporter (DMT)-like permease
MTSTGSAGGSRWRCHVVSQHGRSSGSELVTAEGERPHAHAARTGTVMALVSAASFGSSGPMAKALLEVGWTAGAAVLVRLGGAAVGLSIAAAITLRGRWRPGASSLRTLVIYGFVAMAGAQLAFFNAVRTLDVGVAILLEFLAPVLLLAWTSVRSRTLPGVPTLFGAALTLVGLAFVLELAGASSVDPGGVAWGLVAAFCLGVFFVLSERQDADLPPLVMAAGGTAVGASVIAIAGLMGIVPLAFTDDQAVLAGVSVSWLVPAAWLVLVATVVAYLSGIGAVVRLGTRSASFIALTEVLLAVVAAWVLLAELPGPSQLVGGVCIVVGIVIIRRNDRVVTPTRPRWMISRGRDAARRV